MSEGAPIKQARSPAPVFALLFAGVAGVAGSYAWTQEERSVAATARAEELRKLGETCSEELTGARGESVTTTDKVAACEAARKNDASEHKAMDADLANMQADLSTTRVELDELRKLRAETEK